MGVGMGKEEWKESYSVTGVTGATGVLGQIAMTPEI